ncbi:MAG: hypothetical protein ABIJ97_14850 [Bacteroidota bacterium]
MITKEQIKKILEKHGKILTDNEIIRVRDYFYNIAEKAIEFFRRTRLKELKI